MAITNLCTLADTTHSYVGATDYPGSYSIDENFSTYTGNHINNHDVKNESAASTCTSQHIFAQAYTITSVRYRLYCNTYFTYAGQISWILRLEYTTNGSSWITITETETTGYVNVGSGGASHTDDQGDTTKTVNIANCLGIRAYVYAYHHEGDGWVGSSAFIYEVQAYSIKDIGLRYYKDGWKKIGAEDLHNTHKLRVCKAGTIYGVPLVATTDPTASSVRIYDGSAVKSLPQIT